MQIDKKVTDRQVVVRFPPSPTGEIHIGNVRTLLFNYLFAKKNNGKIVFRFEDTDKERSKKEYEQPMLDALTNLGLSWNEGPYRQSERTEIYKKYLHMLVEAGLAYEDVENADGTGKIVRLKNPEREIVWNDLVKGEIKINTHTFKERDENGNFTGENAADIIIARSIDDPIYHFTVVVDDWLMGVTHVIRGDDHITSTPRQIMILEALRDLKDSESPEVVVPVYAHLPTIIGEDRKKLSKRNGTTSLKAFFELGYMKETMINYLALLGWNPGDEREFFTLAELIEEFSLERCQVSPAQFDFKKLDNINKHYLKNLSDEELFGALSKIYKNSINQSLNFDETILKKIIQKVVRERISKTTDFFAMLDSGELNMFSNELYEKELKHFDVSKFRFKEQTADEVSENMKKVLEIITRVEEQNWNGDILKSLIWDWSATLGRGTVLHPLRTVLSLRSQSPDPFTIMEIIGKEESLRRIKRLVK